MPVKVHERRQLVPEEIVEGFRSVGVGDIGHIQQWGFMDTAIRPVWHDLHLVGTAVTLWMPTMGAALTRRAIMTAAPGDVLVIDRERETQVACWGGFVTMLAKVRGLAGLIVDGAVTDTMEIADLGWPVYTRAVSGLLDRGLGDEGAVNIPVTCGGVTVSPGDLIVADDDGIVVIRPEEAAALLDAWRKRFGHRPSIRQWLREGKAIDDYPGVAEFFQRAQHAPES